MRSSAGVGITPPNVDGAPKPTSSVMISSTFGAPLGGTMRAGHYGFAWNAFGARSCRRISEAAGAAAARRSTSSRPGSRACRRPAAPARCWEPKKNNSDRLQRRDAISTHCLVPSGFVDGPFGAAASIGSPLCSAIRAVDLDQSSVICLFASCSRRPMSRLPTSASDDGDAGLSEDADSVPTRNTARVDVSLNTRRRPQHGVPASIRREQQSRRAA